MIAVYFNFEIYYWYTWINYNYAISLFFIETEISCSVTYSAAFVWKQTKTQAVLSRSVVFLATKTF